MILVKNPGPFTRGFERPQFRDIMESARAAFAGVGTYRQKRAVWVVAPGTGIHGELMENMLPSFWTPSLSRIFGDAAPELIQKSVGLSGNKDTRTTIPEKHQVFVPLLLRTPN